MADQITTSLAQAKILVMEGMKGEPGAPAELVCTLLEDGTLYVDNMVNVPDYESEAF